MILVKLWVLGLDGMTWDFLLPMINEGVLPCPDTGKKIFNVKCVSAIYDCDIEDFDLAIIPGTGFSPFFCYKFRCDGKYITKIKSNLKEQKNSLQNMTSMEFSLHIVKKI